MPVAATNKRANCMVPVVHVRQRSARIAQRTQTHLFHPLHDSRIKTPRLVISKARASVQRKKICLVAKDVLGISRFDVIAEHKPVDRAEHTRGIHNDGCGCGALLSTRRAVSNSE